MSFSIPPLKPFSSSTAYIGFFDGSTLGQPPLRRPGKLNLFMQGPSGINQSLDLYLENGAKNLINSGINLYLQNGQGNNISGGVNLNINGYNKATGNITLYLPDPDCCAISDPIFLDSNGNPINLPNGGNGFYSIVRPAYPKIKHMSSCGTTYIKYYESVAEPAYPVDNPSASNYDYSFSGYLNTFNLSALPNTVGYIYWVKAITIDNCGHSGNFLSGFYYVNS